MDENTSTVKPPPLDLLASVKVLMINDEWNVVLFAEQSGPICLPMPTKEVAEMVARGARQSLVELMERAKIGE